MPHTRTIVWRTYVGHRNEGEDTVRRTYMSAPQPPVGRHEPQSIHGQRNQFSAHPRDESFFLLVPRSRNRQNRDVPFVNIPHTDSPEELRDSAEEFPHCAEELIIREKWVEEYFRRNGFKILKEKSQ